MNQDHHGDGNAAVYIQTNDRSGNQVIAYRRAGDGALTPLGSYDTGGLGTGKPHLASQGSVVLSGDGRWLIVVNAGSDDVSVFAVSGRGLELADRVDAGGTAPTSVTVHGTLLYVLWNGGENAAAGLQGFRIGETGRVSPLATSQRELSRPDADPAQIGFSRDGRTLVVTERGTNSISTFAVDQDGYAEERTTIPSSAATPYGFDFTSAGVLVVTEAVGGRPGAASASSYALTRPGGLTLLSGSVGDTRTEVCWAAIGPGGSRAYVTNFGDGTVSTYEIAADGRLELRDPVAATTVDGQKGLRDEAVSRDGRYLYALHTDTQKLFGWRIDGGLTPVGSFGDLPSTAAGLAAS